MTERAARILLRFDWVDETVTRLWLGAGAYVDGDGDIWKGAALVDESQLDEVDQLINGQAATLNVGLSGVSPETADVAWGFYQDGNLVGSTMKIYIQPCDRLMRPTGSARVCFSGNVDNVIFEDNASDSAIASSLTIQVTNKFSLRRLQNGAVLSDTDQRARSAVLNPGADPDRFAERVVLMQSKTIVWPRFS